MTSEVQIANQALSLIGARAQVASLDPPDGSIEAGLCATFLPLARRLTVENGFFPFSFKRATLAQMLVNESGAWQFAYALPNDCLIPVRIINTGISSKAALFQSVNYQVSLDGLMNETGGADFKQEGGIIYTNQHAAVLLYKVDVEDTRYYTAGFEAAVAMALASLVAGPIIGGTDGIRVANAWSERASAYAKTASANSANATQQTVNHTAPWMAAR